MKHCTALSMLLLIGACSGSAPASSPSASTTPIAASAPAERLRAAPAVPTRVDQVCAYVDVVKGTGIQNRIGDTRIFSPHLATPRHPKGRVGDGGATYTAGPGPVLRVRNSNSEATFHVTPWSLSFVGFRRQTKADYLRRQFRLAFGVSDVAEGTETVSLFPRGGVTVGGTWQTAIAHEYGGVVTHYRLRSATEDDDAVVEFERFVCERNVPPSSPDGAMFAGDCSFGSIEQRLERGVMRLRPGMPLPNVEAKGVTRIEDTGTCDGPSTRVDESQVSLVWKPAG